MTEKLTSDLESPIPQRRSTNNRIFGSIYSYDLTAKILLIGSSNVGKSSMLERFSENTFDPLGTSRIPTAFTIVEKNIRLQNENEGKI